MLRLLLLLFFVLQVVHPIQSLRSIDWSRCTKDAKCFVQGKCTTTHTDQQAEYYKLRYLTVLTDLKNENCTVGVQIIPYSAQKVLIHMQAIGEELGNTTIGLYQNDKPIFGCNITGGSVDVFHEPSLIKKRKPVLYEDFSRFNDNYALCSVTIDKFDTFVTTVKGLVPNSNSILKFEPANQTPRHADVHIPPGQHPYSTYPDLIYNIANFEIKFCDPGTIKHVVNRQNYHVLQIRDRARPEIDCVNYKEELRVDYDYTLFIQQRETDNKTNKLVCDMGSKKYKGIYNGADIEIEDQADFAAYCGVEISKTCKNIFDCTATDLKSCPEFKNGSANKAASLECEGGKWLIDDEYYEGIHPECKEDEMIPNTGSFYLTYPGGTISLKKGQCFHEYDCQKKTRLDISDKVMIANNTMYCTTGKMRVKKENITYDDEKYICNKATGMWRSEKTHKEILENSRVLCEVKKERLAEIRKHSPGELVGYGAAIVVAAAVTSCLIIIPCWCCIFRKDYLYGMTKAKWWNFLSREQKYQAASRIFNMSYRVSPISTGSVLDGLKFIKLLLKSETEYPEIWELAYPFLDRFHGSSRRRGNRLTGVFARYLFLEAKKIIDKHGWISPNRITLTQQQGYIRTVAIRLIFYCRFNDNTEEVTKFIGEGFDKLRYSAVDQYPHCGMLWSYVATCRNKIVQNRFMNDMRSISDGTWNEPLEIPEADQFCEIGDIRVQAEMAIGASLFWNAKHLKFNTSGNRLPTFGHLKGLMRSTQLDMGVMLRFHFAFEDTKKLQDIVPKEKWEQFIDDTIRILICYGQEQMAKRFENFITYPEKLHNHKVEKEVRKLRDKLVKLEQEGIQPKMKKKKIKRYKKENEEKEAKGKEITMKKIKSPNETLEEKKNKLEKEIANTQKYMDGEIKEHQPSERFRMVNAEQQLFEASLAKEEQEIIKWLTTRISKTKTFPSTNNHQRSEATQSTKNDEDTKRSKSAQGTVSNADTAKSAVTSDESYFTALLQEPTVILRIRTCQVNEEEQKRYRALLAEIFADDTIIAIPVDFSMSIVLEITSKVKEIVRTEPMLIEDIPAPITVVADLHGQLYDLDRVFKADAQRGKPGYESTNYLFLGDYVDRGYMSLEVIMALFILKILYPDRIFLLRGNHEASAVNKSYEFIDQLFDRYAKEDAIRLFVAINNSFSFLSIAGIIGNKYFCAHGGITAGSFTRHELRRLQKPYLCTYEDPLISDMLWSDPANKLKGICINLSRGTSIFYGEEEFIHAMENVGCEAMIRGHQVLTNGFEVTWGRLFCIFTSTYAEDPDKNKGAVALVDANLKVLIRVFEADENAYNLAIQYEYRKRKEVERMKRREARKQGKKKKKEKKEKKEKKKRDEQGNEDDVQSEGGSHSSDSESSHEPSSASEDDGDTAGGVTGTGGIGDAPVE